MEFHWKRLIILFTVFTVVIGLLLLYLKIRDVIGEGQNDKIIQEVNQTLNKNKLAFQEATNYFVNINTASKDYYFQYFKGNIKYYSYESLNEPDFIVDESRLLGLYNTFDIFCVRVTDTCNEQKVVSYFFDDFHFYPRNRRVVIRWYKNHICDTTFLTRNNNPEGLDWQFGYDSSITINSYKLY